MKEKNRKNQRDNMEKETMKQKMKLGTITAVVIAGLMIAGAFVSAAVRTTTSSSLSLSEKEEGNTMAPMGWLCGDCNMDGVVDLGDVVYLIGYLYKNGPLPKPNVCVGDVNGSNFTDLGDVVYLIGYLYKNGPPPHDDCCY
jgi:1,4-dihydroxy-2-naphthoate octaprenyltransferase